MIRSNSRNGKPHKNHAFISLADGEQVKSVKQSQNLRRVNSLFAHQFVYALLCLIIGVQKKRAHPTPGSNELLTLVLTLTLTFLHWSLPKIVSLQGQNHRDVILRDDKPGRRISPTR